MERFRAAAASVAIVTKNGSLANQLTAMIADDATSVSGYPQLPELLAALTATAPDIVLLDDVDQRDADNDIRQIRRRLPAVQIVFVNVPSEKRGIDLLHWGADDAICAGSAALTARIQAAARRARTLNAQNRIAVGDIVFDRESRRVWCNGKEVELTPHEFAVVDCLFWHTPKPVDFDTLAVFMWGEDDEGDRKSLVQVYVSYVRRKLEQSQKVSIRYSKGSGYAFVPKA